MSTTLSGLHFYLSHHPDTLAKLTSDIRSRFKPLVDICWGPDLSACLYLRACIDESIRLLPPASGAHWRESEQPGTCLGDPQVEIPANCDVGMSMYALFRRQDVFPHPAKFWPERWLPGVLSDSELANAKKAFQPFLVGSRACAGAHVAIMLVSIAMANLVNKYDFKLVDGPKGQVGLGTADGPEGRRETGELQFESHAVISSWKEGPYVQFRERVY